MRFIVYGAGGVGGVVGGRLAQHGHDVVLIARGKHFDAIRDRGLRIESPDEAVTLRLPVFDRPAPISFTPADIVLLAMKGQDTLAALDALAQVAPPDVAIVCMQNGVANERIALRRFANVYGVFVYCATAHLTPGVVQAWYAPTTGILDIGRYPAATQPTAQSPKPRPQSGPASAAATDTFADTVAAAFRRSTFLSEPRADIMRWKYRKLLMNLGNAVEALCGSAARGSAIVDQARREGVECLNAAGIGFISDESDPLRREKTLEFRPIDGRTRGGGSTWQSLERGATSIETDYLNGEIVLLGRLHGIPTPVNEMLQQLSREAVLKGQSPATLSLDTLASHLHF
jgi:2-dehydropantoate 2-reductase